MQSQVPKLVKFIPKVGFLYLASVIFFLNELSPAISAPRNFGGGIPVAYKLVQLSVIYRHGDRNPKSPYPNSAFSELRYWPEGWGELTVTGMKQHEKFGRALKAMYGPDGYGLLPLKYNLKNYRVVSTDVDRTIMSAMANNAGLWRPQTGDGVREPDVQWTAVPVRVIANNKYDTIFGQNCSRAATLVNAYRDEHFKALKKQFYQLFLYAKEHSGYDLLTYPTHINWLYDTLTVEKIHKGKIPPWAEVLYPEPLESFLMEYYKSGVLTEEVRRLTGGPILKTIIGTMKNFTEGKDSISMYAYSAHETNIYEVLAALDTPPKKPPGYTSALLFELFKNQEDYILRILYRPGLDQSAVVVPIPGCETKQYCSLKTFTKITAHVLPKDLEAECA